MPVLLFLLGAVVALAAGATYATKRNRATPDLGPEEYAQLAERAADAEDYERALHYMGEARRLSPTSRRLAIDHAFFASQAGHADAAIGMLREAILADDADAQLLLTRLLQARGDSDGAARALARALELTPTTLLDVETDPTYEDLMRSDVVQKAARDARRRLE